MADAQADSSLLLQTARSEELTRSLKARFNARRPVSRLPDEILIMLFELLRYWSLGAFLFSVDKCRKWLAVTYVCSRWRRVALSYPRLWTTLVASDRQMVQLFLDRSQSLPLSLHADLTSLQHVHTDTGLICPFDQAIEVALAQGPLRMRDLNFSFDMREPDAIYMDLLTRSPAPILTTFDMKSAPHVGPIHIPNNIFGGSSPNLRTLILSNVTMSPQLHLFRCDLTVLSISDIKTHLRFSAIQLLEVLGKLPHLADLALQGCLPQAAQDTGDLYPHSKLLLPCLVRFYIDGTVAECCNFLPMLWIPCRAMSSIKFVHGGPDQSRDNLEIVSCVNSLFHHPCDPACNSRPTETFRIIYIDTFRFMITVDRGNSSGFTIHFAWADISWLGDWISNVYEDFMSHFLASHVAPANVKSLHLSSNKYVPFLGPNWPTLLMGISPEELSVVGGPAFIGFITAFARPPEPEATDGYQDGLSSIRTLQIQSIDLCSDAALFALLKQGLLRRSAPAGPLRRLVIEKCCIAEEQIQHIRELNIDLDLDWDKKLHGPVLGFGI